MSRPEAFIRACQENTSVLVSMLAWLESERAKVVERLVGIDDPAEIYRLQGEARGLRSIRTLIGQMAKARNLDQQ